MARLHRTLLCSVALCHLAEAFRVKQRRASNSDQQKAVDRYSIPEDSENSGCNDFLIDVARKAVNAALNLTLRGKSPLNKTLHAGKYEIDLWGCNAGLDVDASVKVAGFEGTHIQTLQCDRETETGVVISGRLTFGERIESDAACEASWSLCGLELPVNDSTISMGVRSGDPGLSISIYLEKTRVPFIWRIDRIRAFETDLGDLDGFTCSISNMPDFIGSKFEQWCVSLTSWVADKVQNELMGDVDEIFMGLINDLLDAVPI